jgi:pimeloyl-ACP methyl ester carboxylesterase
MSDDDPNPPLFLTGAPPAPRRRGFLDRPDGARIYFEVTGSGPALVFAHGLGGNHLSWWQQVAAFCGSHSCITFSHRGFHPSTAPEGGPDPAEYAPDLAALLAHLGVSSFALVAQSMGGWTAVSLALGGHPGLRALVLAATSGPIDPRQADPAAFAAWSTRAEAARAEGRRLGIHQAIGARAAAEQPTMHLLYRAIDELSSDLDKEALRARMYAARSRPPSDLAAITVPTLWLTGGEDVVFASPTAPALARAMPRALHVEIPQAGHSAYFEKPIAFNELLKEFLAKASL